MKTLGPKVAKTGQNAWGRYSSWYEQECEVTEDDVGRERLNYLGQGYRSHVFFRHDVGRTFTVYTDGTGWTCWVFTSPVKK